MASKKKLRKKIKQLEKELAYAQKDANYWHGLWEHVVGNPHVPRKVVGAKEGIFKTMVPSSWYADDTNPNPK